MTPFGLGKSTLYLLETEMNFMSLQEWTSYT